MTDVAAELAAGAYEYGVIERGLENFLAWLDANPDGDVYDFRGFREPPPAARRGAAGGRGN